MKQTILLLSLVVAATCCPKVGFGQYVWVPVVQNQPVIEDANGQVVSPAAYSLRVGDQPAAGAGDASGLAAQECGLKGDDCDSKGGCDGKDNCSCPTCRHRNFFRRAFVNVDYMQWWGKGRQIPPLVTSGAGFAPANATAFGGRKYGNDLQSGVRLTGGLWLDDCQSTAVVVRAYGSEGDRSQYNATSAGAPVLGLRFIDTSIAGPPGTPNALVVADAASAPFPRTGTVSVRAENDILGIDSYVRKMIDGSNNYRTDVLVGYRFNRIDDDLQITSSSNVPFTTNDIFDVENEYNAGELGLLTEWNNGPVTFSMLGKLGMGNMRERVAISGASTLGGVPVGEGLYAQLAGLNAAAAPGNIGLYSRDRFVWSPEANIKAAWYLTDHISVSVGYTLLYWTKVMLAGNALDYNINSSHTFNGIYDGGATDPSFAFRDTDYWVQTIDIGFSWNY